MANTNIPIYFNIDCDPIPTPACANRVNIDVDIEPSCPKIDVESNGVEISMSDETFAEMADRYLDTTNKITVPIKRVTWQELVTLCDSYQLVPGQFYRIVDYTCVLELGDVVSAGHKFDIIVQAISTNTISENAKADYNDNDRYFSLKVKQGLKSEAVEVFYTIFDDEDIGGYTEDDPKLGLHSDDILVEYDYINEQPVMYKMQAGHPDGTDYQEWFVYIGTYEFNDVIYDRWNKIEPADGINTPKLYILTNRIIQNNKFIEEVCTSRMEVNADLPAWELKYCLKNDEHRFSWADRGGKGVIYYMKDEYNNEAPYDFKNVQFIRKLNEDGELDLENGIDTWCYTFGGLIDRSISNKNLQAFSNNSISACYDADDSDSFRLPENVLLGGYNECVSNNNKFGINCSGNTLDVCSQNNIVVEYIKLQGDIAVKGTIQSNEPITDQDVANKKYVDDWVVILAQSLPKVVKVY